MRFTSYNVQYGIGVDGRFDPERIAASLRVADNIALQEVMRNFHRNGNGDHVRPMPSTGARCVWAIRSMHLPMSAG